MGNNKKKKSDNPLFKRIFIAVFCLIAAVTGFGYKQGASQDDVRRSAEQAYTYVQEILEDLDNVETVEEIPEYEGETYITVNDNEPEFTEEQQEAEPYEYYSDLDSLDRCGYAEAKITEDLMPTEKRESISSVKPSGWQNEKYDCVDGKYLYNRCHLLGYQLTGENANEKNLITGTRYLNVDGMLPFENEVATYIKDTGNAVLMRVTPVFEGDELVARGVQMEAQSVEDDEISFNVFVYNIQPGVEIDYATGESQEE